MPSLMFLLSYIKAFTNKIWIVIISTCNWPRKWNGLNWQRSKPFNWFSYRAIRHYSQVEANKTWLKPNLLHKNERMVPLCGNNSLVSASLGGPVSKHLPSSIWGFSPLRVSSSATKEVVTLTSGNIAILDTWLKRAMETPTAASSTGPAWTNNI